MLLYQFQRPRTSLFTFASCPTGRYPGENVPLAGYNLRGHRKALTLVVGGNAGVDGCVPERMVVLGRLFLRMVHEALLSVMIL
jgi:hypothetical protein